MRRKIERGFRLTMFGGIFASATLLAAFIFPYTLIMFNRDLNNTFAEVLDSKKANLERMARTLSSLMASDEFQQSVNDINILATFSEFLYNNPSTLNSRYRSGSVLNPLAIP